MIQKKVVPLHSQLRNQPVEVAMILGYGVMVTLQILVLSFLVRVRVSQLHLSNGCLKSKIGIWCNGNTTDSGPVIPGSSPGIPTREHLSFERCFFFIPPRLSSICPRILPGIKKKNPELSPWVYDEFNDFFYCISASNYLFSASIALIFSFTSFKSSFNFSTLRFISSTRLLPFLLAALRKPRLFS